MVKGEETVNASIICFSCVLRCYRKCLNELFTNNSQSSRQTWSAVRNDERRNEVYQFKSWKGLLAHHEKMHADSEPVRLLCRKCLQFFDQPGLAEKHLKRNEKPTLKEGASTTGGKKDSFLPYFCSLCPYLSLESEDLFAKHIWDKHKVTFCSFTKQIDLSDATKLRLSNRRVGDIDLKIHFWSWTGREAFTPLGGRESSRIYSQGLKVSRGCNFVPKWPYVTQFACGLCSKVSDYKVRVANHLKFKHNILTPDKRIARGEQNKEDDLLVTVEQNQSDSESGDDDSDDSRYTSRMIRHSRVARRGCKKFYYCSVMYKCVKCGKLFDSKPAVFQHHDKTHQFLDEVESGMFTHHVDDFCCSFCDVKFPLVNSVKQHEREKHKELVAICESSRVTHS